MHLCFEPIGTILLISYHLHFTAIADCVHHVLLHTKILCVLSHQLPWQQRMQWVFFSCNLSQVNFEQFDFRQLFDTCLDCSSQTSSLLSPSWIYLTNSLCRFGFVDSAKCEVLAHSTGFSLVVQSKAVSAILLIYCVRCETSSLSDVLNFLSVLFVLQW